MSFFDLFFKLQAKARAIALAFINLDFGVLDKRIFGLVSIIDLAALALAFYIIKELLKFLISFTMNMLKAFSSSAYQYSSTFFAAFLSIVLTRATYTLIYLYRQPIMLDLREKTLSFFRDRVKLSSPFKK